jgi:outer membrane protein insertion porin family
MKIEMIWFLLFLMCGWGAGIPALAQSSRAKKTATQPAQPRQWPIESLKVEGNHNYTAAQILAVAGMKVGQMAGKSDFEAAHDRLVATGMFETVGYKFSPGGDGHGYAASFQVVEVQPAYPIRFDDLGATEKDLAEFLRGKDPLFAPRLAATKAVLERYRQWIQEYVTAHNDKDTVIAKVTPAGAPASPGEFVILFRPARSDPAVAEVAFEGNQAIPTSALQNAIAEVAVGLPYKEEAFRQCLDSSIRPLYDARGRVRVAFTKLTVEKATDVQGLAVKVTLVEGGTYDLGTVRIEGAPDFAPARLLKTGKFKTGDLADFDEIGKGVDRIRKVVAHEGYMRNEVQIVRKIDDAKKTVSLVLHIDEGPLFLFGKLSIEGLDLNGEAAIRKMWTHQDGTPYNPDYPDYFLKHVREEGLFDNLGETRAETKIDDKTHIVSVTLYFKYAPPPVNRKKTSPF